MLSLASSSLLASARRASAASLLPLLARGLSSSSVEPWQLAYAQLAQAVAPGAAVAAGRGEHGRGLFATRNLPQGSVVLSVDLGNTLYAAGGHPGSSAAARSALKRWRKQHSAAPPALVRFLTEGKWCLLQGSSTGL